MEIMNICWYKDEDLAIYFDKEPEISVQYLRPHENAVDVYKKPFRLEKSLNVWLFDFVNEHDFFFSIPFHYAWDGASIPRFFWRLLGSKTDNRFLIASLIHDVLCENHDYIDGDIYLSTIVFERLLYVSKVNAFNRWMIKHSVDNFQKFCGWEN